MAREFTHPAEDEIARHACGDGSPDERQVMALHLSVCESCRRVAGEFAWLMHASAGPDVPEPGEDFEERMWRRIESSLPVRTSRWSVRNVALVSGWAATIALAVVGGSRWAGFRTPSAHAPAPPASVATDVREQVLFTALDSHLGQTEVLLVELMNAPASSGELSLERQMADDLVNSGRLYRVTAQETGHGLFSAVLDDVEPVLVDVARSGDVLGPDDLAALRERIVQGDLLFKVRAAARGARSRQGVGDL